MKKEYSVIGKPVPAQDSVPKITGSIKFCDDLVLPNMLHGKILRSPFAHAKILNIDTSRAERLTGVKAVVTGRDTLGKKYGYQWARVDGKWLQPGLEDRYPLCMDKVRFIGDEVAAVAATDEDIAEEAIDLIRVEYEELLAVFDPEEAIEPGAPQIHEGVDRNIYWRPKHALSGDVREGFKESEYVREDKFELLAPVPGFIEPLCVIASFDSTKKLQLWATTQCPPWLRVSLSELLDIPMKDITVNKPPLGGGFGGKTTLFPHDYCAALLSIKTGRPVKILQTMDEVFIGGTRKCSYKYWVKTGVKRDGTLVAREARILANGGAYCLIGILLAETAAFYLHVPYKIPHFWAETSRVYTNTSPRVVQRAAGNDQSNFINGLIMDMIAEDLAIDTVALRLKNTYQTGDTTPMGWYFPTLGLSDCIHAAVERSGWKDKRGKILKNRGIGMGNCIDITGMGIPPGHHVPAMIKLQENSKVIVNVPTWEMGQSSGVAFSMIAAEVLGISVDDTEYISTGTGDYPTETGSPNEGSFAAKAVFQAAEDAKEQLFKDVSDMLECRQEDLEAKGGRIYVKGNPEKGMDFFEAVKASAWKKGNPIIGRGSYYCGETLMKIFRKEQRGGSVAETYASGAYVAEVEVDPETGIVKIEKMTCAYDVGQAINPLVVEGQIEGATVMGMGYALWEGIIQDHKGQILNPSFSSYPLPSANDLPDIDAIIVEIPDPTQIFGLKAGGMGVMHPAPGAIASAIFHATKEKIKGFPITPEDLLELSL